MVYGIYDLACWNFWYIYYCKLLNGLIELLSTTGDDNLGGDDFDPKFSLFDLEQEWLW